MRTYLTIVTLAVATTVIAAQSTIVAVPGSPATNEVVTLIPPDAGGQPAEWTASGGQWCISRSCDWVSPDLTIPAFADPAYWRATAAGTYTITHTLGDTVTNLSITVSAAE